MKKEKKKMTEEQREEWFKAVRKDDIETVKMMLKEGFDVNAHGENRWTALHWSCYNGYIETAKLLLDNGSDVNYQDNYVWTPLHLACYYGRIDTVKLLIDNSADITAKDNDGKTPLDELKQNNPKRYQELIEWLAEHHPDKALELIAHENIQSKGVGL